METNRKLLIISTHENNYGPALTFDGETIQEAAKDPASIGKVMVDMLYGEGLADGIDTSRFHVLVYEKNTNKTRKLQEFETGYEDLLTGGYVRVFMLNMPPSKVEGMHEAVRANIAKSHGKYRNVNLVEFVDAN